MSYAVIVPEYGYAYLNMPKAACTSIKEAIGQQHGHDARWVRKNSCMYHSRRNLVGRDDLWRWTVVRHPAARLVSCWREVVDPSDRILELNPGLRRKRGLSFPEFVAAVGIEDDWRANAHYAQQSYLAQYRGLWLLDAFFHLEKLAEMWPHIQQRTGLGELPHLRPSRHAPWQSYYDPRLRALVETRYRDDFEKFGYTW